MRREAESDVARAGGDEETDEFKALPFPGDDLAFRVAGSADRQWFFKSGRQSAQDIVSILGVVGSRPDAHERILDFGCGCGRVLPWLKGIADSSALYGIDIDAAAIEWARAHLPYADVRVNQAVPPTDFPDAFFDLVYCHSVFTHLDEGYQDEWLGELGRVVKPGGLLLVSVNGEHAFRQLEDAWRAAGSDPKPLRASRDDAGMLYIADDQWTGGPFPDFYHTTFHTAPYIFAHWSRYFRIRAYVPQGALSFQDCVLLERVDAQILETVSAATQAWNDGAIAHLAQLLERGPGFDYPRRFGGLSTFARKVVLRILRHYSSYQREVHAAVLDALRGLDGDNHVLRERIRQQDGRIRQRQKQRER
jgi:SAM-dependent methyltransferase